jgi:hypothetical protein
MVIEPAMAQIAIGIRVRFGPPAIPIYEMPPCPGDGYLWTPGYWGWDDGFDDYYWVPGTWILAPEPGFLWTPGWWGWDNDAFLWHEGFWGPTVGFYGGINYGFGYFGTGFVGGRWDHDHFFYNRAVVNINTTVIHNVYEDRTVVHNENGSRVAYNGGEGGVTARPTPEEERAANERHVAPVAAQTQHIQAARSNPQMRASANQGKPPVAATARPGEFSGRGVVAAKQAGAPYHPPANGGAPRSENEAARPGAAPGGTPMSARDLQPHQVPESPNTGNPSLDKKYRQQQQKLVDQQNKEHEKLAKQQAKEEKQAEKQQLNEEKKQQMQQRHAQEAQQMEQRHTQQRQQLEQRQMPAPRPARPPR